MKKSCVIQIRPVAKINRRPGLNKKHREDHGPVKPRPSAMGMLVLFLTFSAQADWPNFRGPDHNGISPETGINTDWNAKPPPTLWTVDLTDQGYSAPSVAEGLLIIVDHENETDIVKAFDEKTGVEKWRFSYEAVGEENYGWARAAPAIENGRVYLVNRDGVVHCLDINGKKVWRRDVVKDVKGSKPRWSFSNSPVIDGPLLIVPGGGKDAHIVALNKETGQTRWKGGGSDKLGYATPVVANIEGKKQYLLFNAKGLSGVDASNGKELWGVPWKTSYGINAADPIPIGNNLVFIGSGYKKGCGVFKIVHNSAKQVWENTSIISRFNSGVLVDGHIYCTGEPGFLVCLDPRNGETKWKEREFEWGGLLAVDGHVIVMNGRDGDAILVETNPDAYKEKGRIKPLGGRSWTAPILADKTLFVRNREKLAAVDLR